MAERRHSAERRTLRVTPESIAEVEARLARLGQTGKGCPDDDGSGWDKLIIPVE